MAWATHELARSIWADAELMDDDLLAFWLEVVKPAIRAYAPALPVATQIPEAWQLAQIMQARNAFNAAKASPSGGLDGSNYGVTTRPLDWQVKQLLRPRRGRVIVR